MEKKIERRITFQYGVNSPRTHSGFMSFDELHNQVRHETMGEVDILKYEERTVTYSDWSNKEKN